MASVLLVVDRFTEDEILADLLDHGHAVVARAETADEAIDLLGRLPVEIVVAGGSHARLSAALLAACDTAGARLVVLAADQHERRTAAALGIFEVLDAGVRWRAVEALLSAPPVLMAGRRDPVETGAGVIAVWGPAGAPGRSALAVAIAAELAGRGRSVVLADADPYGGTVAPALGLLDESPGFAAACRLAAASALTREEFERLAQEYVAPGTRFRVLTGITSASRWPELAPARVTSVLEAAAGWLDAVVVDVGFSLESDEEISSDRFAPRRNGATVAALQAAHRVVAVGAADPVSLPRFLRGYAELAELVDPARISVVVNRVRGSAVGLDAGGQVRSSLRRFGGLDRVALVPADARAFDAAVLAGRALRDAAPRSQAQAAVARFVAEELLPASARREERRRTPRRIARVRAAAS